MSNHEAREPARPDPGVEEQLLRFGFVLGTPITSSIDMRLNRYVAIDHTNAGWPMPARVVMVEEDRYTVALVSVTTGQLNPKVIRISRHAVEAGAVPLFRLTRLQTDSIVSFDDGVQQMDGRCYRDNCYELEICNWYFVPDGVSPESCKGVTWDPICFTYIYPPTREDFLWTVNSIPWFSRSVEMLLPQIERGPWPVVTEGYKYASVDVLDALGALDGRISVSRKLVLANRRSGLSQDPVSYLPEVIKLYRGKTRVEVEDFFRVPANQHRWRERVGRYPYLDGSTMMEVAVYVSSLMLLEVGIRKSRARLPVRVVTSGGDEPVEPTSPQPSRRIRIDG